MFFKYYQDYLEKTNTPDGSGKFYEFGINYYTKAQTQTIIERIKNDKPLDFERLLPWLEKAVAEYNGFYLLGV